MVARKRHATDTANGDDIVPVKHITGKELTDVEELRTRLSTLVDLLNEKGIINKSEFNRTVVMRLHEVSKAAAFEVLDEEL